MLRKVFPPPPLNGRPCSNAFPQQREDVLGGHVMQLHVLPGAEMGADAVDPRRGVSQEAQRPPRPDARP